MIPFHDFKCTQILLKFDVVSKLAASFKIFHAVSKIASTSETSSGLKTNSHFEMCDAIPKERLLFS